MIATLIPLSGLQFEKVHYYSVRLGDAPASEFSDFRNRMDVNPQDRLELGEIFRFIENIGEVYGAQPQHFKTEDAAEALPPPYYQYLESDDPNDFGLRLYCIRLSPSIVILLNGARKTALKVKDCPECYPHFDRARKLSKKLTEAIHQRDVVLDEDRKEIVIYDDYELTF